MELNKFLNNFRNKIETDLEHACALKDRFDNISCNGQNVIVTREDIRGYQLLSVLNGAILLMKYYKFYQ